MNLLKIKGLAEKRIGGIKKLATDINMSEANLHRCLNVNKIQATDLEKIATIFNVSVGYFFDEVALDEKRDDLLIELNKYKKEVERLREIINSEKTSKSGVFLALPLDDDEFIDLREMKDKVIRILSK